MPTVVLFISYENACIPHRILLCNIKIETERNDENSMKLRNDFCYILGEIVDNCSIDKNEYSDDIVTGICVYHINN